MRGFRPTILSSTTVLVSGLLASEWPSCRRSQVATTVVTQRLHGPPNVEVTTRQISKLMTYVNTEECKRIQVAADQWGLTKLLKIVEEIRKTDGVKRVENR